MRIKTNKPFDLNFYIIYCLINSSILFSKRKSSRANDSGDEEEFFYYDEEDSLGSFTPNPTHLEKPQPIPVDKHPEISKNDDAESNHSVYASATTSVSSSPVESSVTDSDDSDDSVYDALDENLTEDSDSKSISSLVEEDLEKKKRLLHRQAKQLLRKNKKLRKNYALTAENIITVKSSNYAVDNDMWQVNTQTAVRKSLRTRKTARKFVDREYAFEDEMSEDTSSESSEAGVRTRIKTEGWFA